MKLGQGISLPLDFVIWDPNQQMTGAVGGLDPSIVENTQVLHFSVEVKPRAPLHRELQAVAPKS